MPTAPNQAIRSPRWPGRRRRQRAAVTMREARPRAETARNPVVAPGSRMTDVSNRTNPTRGAERLLSPDEVSGTVSKRTYWRSCHALKTMSGIPPAMSGPLAEVAACSLSRRGWTGSTDVVRKRGDRDRISWTIPAAAKPNGTTAVVSRMRTAAVNRPAVGPHRRFRLVSKPASTKTEANSSDVSSEREYTYPGQRVNAKPQALWWPPDRASRPPRAPSAVAAPMLIRISAWGTSVVLPPLTTQASAP